jgi:hypothetical protein
MDVEAFYKQERPRHFISMPADFKKGRGAQSVALVFELDSAAGMAKQRQLRCGTKKSCAWGTANNNSQRCDSKIPLILGIINEWVKNL